MVVISAAICSKSGKILLARQFVAINRLKMEEYIANFPPSNPLFFAKLNFHKKEAMAKAAATMPTSN